MIKFTSITPFLSIFCSCTCGLHPCNIQVWCFFFFKTTYTWIHLYTNTSKISCFTAVIACNRTD